MSSTRRSFIMSAGMAGAALIAGRRAAAFGLPKSTCGHEFSQEQPPNRGVCPPGCTGVFPNCDCSHGRTDWSPYTNWANVYTQQTQAYDDGFIQNTLLGIFNSYLSYGIISPANIASFNAGLYNHALFHCGSGSGYHYGACQNVFVTNCPPNHPTVNFPTVTSANLTWIKNYMVDNFGIDLSRVVPSAYEIGSPFFTDSSFGTSTPSTGVAQILGGLFGWDQKAAANQGQANPGACHDLGIIQDVFASIAVVSLDVAVLAVPGSPVSDGAAVVAAATATSAWITSLVAKHEQC